MCFRYRLFFFLPNELPIKFPSLPFYIQIPWKILLLLRFFSYIKIYPIDFWIISLIIRSMFQFLNYRNEGTNDDGIVRFSVFLPYATRSKKEKKRFWFGKCWKIFKLSKWRDKRWRNRSILDVSSICNAFKKGKKKGRILIWKMLKNGENVYYDLPRARYAKGGNWKQVCYSILAVALSRE